MEGHCILNGNSNFCFYYCPKKAIFLNIMILFSFSTDYGDRWTDMRFFGISSQTTSSTKFKTFFLY